MVRSLILLFALNRGSLAVFVLSLLTACGGGGGGSSTDNTQKANNNLAPVLDIGDDRSVELDQSPIVLTASINDDGLPTNFIAIQWTLIDSPVGSGTLSNADNISTNFSFSSPGVYLIQATAADGELATTENLVITVNVGDTAPVVDAGIDQSITLPDNQITLNGSFTDDIDPGNPYIYNWEVLSPIGANVVFENANALSTNVTFDRQGVYQLSLSVFDGTSTGTDTLTITVNQNLVGTFPRPENTSCIAPNLLALQPTEITLEPAFPNLLHLGEVKALKQPPNNNNIWYALLPQGKILEFANNELTTTYTEFLNIENNIRYDNGGQLGLLGMAFHPDYQNNNELFLHYTRDDEEKIKGNNEIRLRSTISRFINDNGAWTEEVILQINQPDVTNNGGSINFGTDGYLYINIGDGGGDNDPSNYGQDTTTLLGSILRIDVDSATPYAIPQDNPFAANTTCDNPEIIVNNANCPEIYAYGLRNPTQHSFDLFGTDIWNVDSGQTSRAEINKIISGNNYGWREMEGNICRPDLGNTCDQTGLTPPLYDYDFVDANNNIVGGFIYRGFDIDFLRGQYIFADRGTNKIYGLTDQAGTINVEELLTTNLVIYGIAQSNAGELYVLNPTPGALARGNNIFKIVPDLTGTEPKEVAPLLSETGCVSPTNPITAVDAMIPYDVINPLWSDNADKERYFAIPDGSTIDINSDGEFIFPVGSVLMKHFKLDGEYIETRLLMYHPEGWLGYSYEWQYDLNNFPTDAVLLDTGKTKLFGNQNWHYPTRQNCLECHTANAGRTLGSETLQLNREYTFPHNGIYTENLLSSLEQMGMFTSPITQQHMSNKLVATDDVTASFESRSKSYIHSNCANCHRPGGAPALDMRYLTPFSQMGMCDARAMSGDMGLPNPLIIDPTGSYFSPNSVLPLRLEATLDSGFRMPPISSEIVDTQALDIIKNWINDLTICP